MKWTMRSEVMTAYFQQFCDQSNQIWFCSQGGAQEYSGCGKWIIGIGGLPFWRIYVARQTDNPSCLCLVSFLFSSLSSCLCHMMVVWFHVSLPYLSARLPASTLHTATSLSSPPSSWIYFLCQMSFRSPVLSTFSPISLSLALISFHQSTSSTSNLSFPPFSVVICFSFMLPSSSFFGAFSRHSISAQLAEVMVTKWHDVEMCYLGTQGSRY